MAAGGRPWWGSAVIYEVYVRSAADGNGDGVGDLIGLRQRLEHFVDLGVDAIWLSPIYPHGGVDGGYDVTDFDSVAEEYGGTEALDALVAEAHERGLRVLMDFVPNHTSDRHAWFREAMSSLDSPKRDWYLWADPRDGGPPNNWPSAFGGSAWQLDPASGRYYLTTYYPQQIDLNWRNPEVRHAVIGAMRRWVDGGVDGFRIDAIHSVGKDPELRDNPLGPDSPEVHGQLLLHSQDHPDVHGWLREMRSELGPDVCLLGEVWLHDLEQIFGYVRPDTLDMAFHFPFMRAPWEVEAKAACIELAESLSAESGAWPSYHLSNHDDTRHATRIGTAAVPAAAVLLLTLRGTPVLYLGEEIGMEDVDVPPARRLDRVGRDSVRTPMQWDATANAGFTRAGTEPWLPVGNDHEIRNVATQRDDPDSVFSLYRRLIALRRRSPALTSGNYRRLEAPDHVLAFAREAGGERLVVVVNFGDRPTAIDGHAGVVAAGTNRAREGARVSSELPLDGNEAVVLRATGR